MNRPKTYICIYVYHVYWAMTGIYYLACRMLAGSKTGVFCLLYYPQSMATHATHSGIIPDTIIVVGPIYIYIYIYIFIYLFVFIPNTSILSSQVNRVSFTV